MLLLGNKCSEPGLCALFIIFFLGKGVLHTRDDALFTHHFCRDSSSLIIRVQIFQIVLLFFRQVVKLKDNGDYQLSATYASAINNLDPSSTRLLDRYQNWAVRQLRRGGYVSAQQLLNFFGSCGRFVNQAGSPTSCIVHDKPHCHRFTICKSEQLIPNLCLLHAGTK